MGKWALFLIIEQIGLDVFPWWLCKMQREKGVCKASWELGLEMAHHHLPYILLVKTNHKASLDAQGEEIVYRYWWDELQSHMQETQI